jgi:alkylation response protein AidB-like acyl-CoA dehydrogenase
MRWELSEEQELFTTSLREWLAERAGLAAVRGWLDAGDLSSFERLFVGEGWAGVGFDEELGGQGGGLLEIALTARRRRPAGCSRRSSSRRWPTSQRWRARHPSPVR